MTLSSTVGLFSTSTVTMERRSYCDKRVSLSVRISQKLHVQTSPIFVCVLPTAVVYYCFGDVVICDVLPVL